MVYLEDTARVLGRMYDGIEYRGFDQSIVEELSEKSGVPVWNGLTNQFHPTQMLSDIMTAEENFGDLRGKTMVFMGDARNNVANSLMVVSSKLGINFIACGPKQQMPEKELVDPCRKIAEENGSTISLIEETSFSSMFILFTSPFLPPHSNISMTSFFRKSGTWIMIDDYCEKV